MIKILAAAILVITVLVGVAANIKNRAGRKSTIDQSWWDGLPAEWQSILLVNQQFQKNGIDVFVLQEDYINRLNAPGEPGRSAINISLYALNHDRQFSLGYQDLFERATRKKILIPTDTIDLESLAQLTTVYMVNGPADLTPLERLPQLKVLVINFCGIDNSSSPGRRVLNLEPLQSCKELRVFHCAATGTNSLKGIGNLINLQELDCSNSDVTTLSPIRKMVELKKLIIGSKILNAKMVAKFENLEELELDGCKDLPVLKGLKKLKKLCIAENELAIVDASYRLNSLGFLHGLAQLEYLDLQHTSYRGSLAELDQLPNLKAVSLPRVSSSYLAAFKRKHPNCVILNEYEW